MAASTWRMRPASASAWSAGRSAETQALGEEIVHLLRAYAAAAVEREVPGDAHQPGPKLDDFVQLPLALQDAQEDVLDYVLRLGRVAQQGERDAIEQAGVVMHQRGQIGLSLHPLCREPLQALFPDRVHSFLLLHRRARWRSARIYLSS